MERVQAGNIESDAQERAQLRLLFPGEEHAVRGALKDALTAFRQMGLDDDQRASVELVLAEVFNNVVEHAYAGRSDGVIEVRVSHGPEDLEFSVYDDGLPMPGGEAPAGIPHDLNVELEDLPEGGYGWFLIRELTEDLCYCRAGNRNELRFRIPVSAEDCPG